MNETQDKIRRAILLGLKNAETNKRRKTRYIKKALESREKGPKFRQKKSEIFSPGVLTPPGVLLD